MKRGPSILSILLTLLFLIFVTACHNERLRIPGTDKTRPDTSSSDRTTREDWARLEKEIHKKINDERRRHRLAPLQWDGAVCNAARSHSTNMADRSFFSHKDPIRGGLQQRVQHQKLAYSTCGENLFRLNFTSGLGDSVVKGWMKSPSHRKNILEPEFKMTGIGVSKGKDGFVYITQIFMTP